jgi:hypothetical protein
MKKSVRALVPLFFAIGLVLSACTSQSANSLDSIPDYSALHMSQSTIISPTFPMRI